MTPFRVTLVSGLGAYSATAPSEVYQYAAHLGVLTLASLARDRLPVTVIDLDDHWRRSGRQRPRFDSTVLESICASRPDVIGFSTISGSYPFTIRTAQKCSELLPNATILFGGPQATVTDSATLSAFPFIDLILRGEADESFPKLLEAIGEGSSGSNIPGLSYRHRGEIRRNPDGPVLVDMDRLPLPAYDLVPCIDELAALPLELGRGCPFSCTFCSTNDFFRRRFRLKAPEHVLDEMNQLHERWGICTFDLVHDMFTVDRRRVVEFCETMIAAGSPYRWSCSARTDCVDSELIGLMKRAGCHNMFFGIETGSQRMQHVIDKGLDLAGAREVLRETNRLQMHSTASLIIGYPQETEDDLQQTAEFFADAMRLPWCDPQLNVLSPLAGTPITEEYRERLALDEGWAGISENGTLQDGVERLMIAAHADIFPNFYAFPFYTARELLRLLRAFFFQGRARCGGLLQAVHLHTGNLFGVFQLWSRSCPDSSRAWLESLDFAQHLISFCEAHHDTPSVRATARFYRSAFAQAAPPVLVPRPDAFLALAQNVRLVDCDCDINAVLEALAEGRDPGEEALGLPSTVAIQTTSINSVHIRRFPPLALDLLRHAARNSTLAEIEEDFEGRGLSVSGLSPEQVARGGIEYLEGLGLVRRTVPDAMAKPPAQAQQPMGVREAAC